jgi:hypothetical protein
MPIARLRGDRMGIAALCPSYGNWSITTRVTCLTDRSHFGSVLVSKRSETAISRAMAIPAMAGLRSPSGLDAPQFGAHLVVLHRDGDHSQSDRSGVASNDTGSNVPSD